MKPLILPLILIASLLASCVDVPEPPTGFFGPFYTQFDFLGNTIRFEESDIDVGYSLTPSSTAIYSFTNTFSDSEWEVSLSLRFTGEPSLSDIKDLEGKTLGIDSGQSPYFSMYISEKAVVDDYTTEADDVDYGPAAFVINSVEKSVKTRYAEPGTGEGKDARSYVIRGTMMLNVTGSAQVPGIPISLNPITNGQFSIKVFVP